MDLQSGGVSCGFQGHSSSSWARKVLICTKKSVWPGMPERASQSLDGVLCWILDNLFLLPSTSGSARNSRRTYDHSLEPLKDFFFNLLAGWQAFPLLRITPLQLWINLHLHSCFPNWLLKEGKKCRGPHAELSHGSALNWKLGLPNQDPLTNWHCPTEAGC